MSQDAEGMVPEQIREELKKDLTKWFGATVGRGSSEADGHVFPIRIDGTPHILEIQASALLQARNQGVDGLMEALQLGGWVERLRAQGRLCVKVVPKNNYKVGPCDG